MLSAIGRALHLAHRTGIDGLRKEIEKLDRKLRRIKVTIEEVENKEIHDEAVNFWLQELKCLATDAEDVLDEYHYEILQCQLEVKLDGTTMLSSQVTDMDSNSAMINHVSSCFSERFLLEMLEKIRHTNSQLDEILRDREALRLTNEEGQRRGGSSSINLYLTSHLMKKDDVFGRSGDKENIIYRLFAGLSWPDEVWHVQLRVIPILGMGGIGKTTLAQMVYNDNFVQSMFDVMAWIHVSPEFDIIRLTKEICEFVTGKPGNSFDGFSKIQEVLQEELVGKKMLLILDDVWNVQQNDWELLVLPLRVAEVVRVLVTSRNDVVTQTLQTASPHRLHVLPEDECLKLLYHCVFDGNGMGEKEWSEDMGRQIIKRCGGLPLAVKCIGKALRYNKDKNRWREILDSELWESDKLDPIFCALKVSYYHLPPMLRDCFLFCSLFPKGCRLRKISIIHMWMAHGFLRPRGRKRPEDVGEEYIAELQMRSFIVPCTKSSFRLHDVIYDLARSLSVDRIHTIMDEKSSNIPDEIQHLYIKRGNNPSQSSRPDIRLRTLFNATLKPHDSFIDLPNISLVRVLGLLGSNVLALAYSPLKHLRYLEIMKFGGEALPEQLCLLYHLQTLKINHCYHLRELPINIANLVNLRYLHITHVGIEELPVMLWRVHNLQMLRLKECYKLRVLPSGISKLKNLYILELKSCKQLEELPSDTGNIIKLSLLDISFSGIRTFPASIGKLKLAKIVLVGVPDIVTEQLTSNSLHLITTPPDTKDVHLQGIQNQSDTQDTDDVELMENGFNGPSIEDKQTAVAELPEYSSKWGQKLVLLGSKLWHKINNKSTATKPEDINCTVAEDIDSARVDDLDDIDRTVAEDINSARVDDLDDIDGAVAEDIDSARVDADSFVTWMSSQNRSSMADDRTPRWRPDLDSVVEYNINESRTNLAQDPSSPMSSPEYSHAGVVEGLPPLGDENFSVLALIEDGTNLAQNEDRT